MAWTKPKRRRVWWVLFIAISLPLVWLFFNWALLLDEAFVLGYLDGFGPNILTANPIEFTNRYLGDWALRFLLLSLTVTPAARVFSFIQLIAYRRMIGLWAFTYVCFHLSSYIVLDQFFDWSEIWTDILKRTFITLGMVSFLLLLPMAITSTKGWVKRLGAKTWKRIHRAIYVIAPLASVHYFMMSKGNQLQPKIYLGLTAFLLLIRVWFYAVDKIKAANRRAAA